MSSRRHTIHFPLKGPVRNVEYKFTASCTARRGSDKLGYDMYSAACRLHYDVSQSMFLDWSEKNCSSYAIVLVAIWLMLAI